MIEGIKAQMDRIRYLSLDDATPLPLIIEQHTRIVDGIEAGDPAFVDYEALVASSSWAAASALTRGLTRWCKGIASPRSVSMLSGG